MCRSFRNYTKLILVGNENQYIIEYDILKKEWKEVLRMRQPIQHFRVVCINRRIVIAGGTIFDSVVGHSLQRSIHMFDLATNQIQYDCGQLPIPLFGFQMCSFGNFVYIIGGETCQDNNCLSTVYKSDMCGERFNWESLSPMIEVICGFSCVVHNQFIYLFGGLDESAAISRCAKYNTLTDSWSRVADMPVAIADTSAAVFEDEIYVVGGCVHGECGAEDITSIYSPKTDSWRVGPSLTFGRAYFSLINMNGCLWAIGGASRDNRFGSYEVMEGGTWFYHTDSPLGLFIDGAVLV